MTDKTDDRPDLEGQVVFKGDIQHPEQRGWVGRILSKLFSEGDDP